MAATLYGHAVDSDLALPRIRHGDAPRGRLTVRRAAAHLPREGDVEVDLDDRFTVHRGDGRLVVWCERSGTYAVDVTAGTIETEQGPGGPGEWEHRLACVVVPLLLAERGDLALHAAAVETPAGAVALCGRSTAGKSTTAWVLGERGYGVLAEDGIVVTTDDQPLLWPGLAGVRLRAASGDRPVVASGDAPADPVPLAAVVILGSRTGTAPAAERLAPLEGLTALMPHGVHAQGPSQAAVFRGAAAVTRTVPVFRATLPDDLPRAGEHAEALLSALRLA